MRPWTQAREETHLLPHTAWLVCFLDFRLTSSQRAGVSTASAVTSSYARSKASIATKGQSKTSCKRRPALGLEEFCYSLENWCTGPARGIYIYIDVYAYIYREKPRVAGAVLWLQASVSAKKEKPLPRAWLGSLSIRVRSAKA